MIGSYRCGLGRGNGGRHRDGDGAGLKTATRSEFCHSLTTATAEE